MLFNSLPFFLLVCAFVLCFFGASGLRRHGPQVVLMLVFSCVFYAWGQLALLPLLLFSAGINSFAAYRVALSPGSRRWWVAGVVAFNVAVLVFFKYANLLVETIPFLHGWVGESYEPIPLPVGISFFTFQGISLIMDVSREEELRKIVRARRWPRAMLEMGTYICFFPQLVAGPIVKARTFLPQYRLVRLQDVNLPLAARFLIIGFFFKMVVADNLKDFTVYLSEPGFGALRAGDLVLALYGYSFQIYADFMGYSVIAVGLGLLCGYNFPQNFRLPYLSSSFAEFWTRWHISLSTWLREYLYIPLGGNRLGQSRTLANLMIVMLLGGLWHGAGWNYLVWGGGHGLALVAERIIMGKRKIKGRKMGMFARVVWTLFVFHVVTVLWLLFILPDFNGFISFWREVGTRPLSVSPNIAFGVLLFSLPVVFQHLWCAAKPGPSLYDSEGIVLPDKRISIPEAIGLGVLLAVTVVNAGTSSEFIYFQF